MATTHTLNVRGQRVRTRTNRRYAVVYTRTEARHTPEGVYVPFARVEKRTDNLDTARTTQRRIGYGSNGCFAVIIDTTTGEEVS